MHNPEGARADAQMIPHPTAWKDLGRRHRRRVQPFDAVHQAGPQHIAPIGNRRGQHRDLNWRDPHRVLSNGKVSGVAIRPP